jgi:hypothetical protein
VVRVGGGRGRTLPGRTVGVHRLPLGQQLLLLVDPVPLVRDLLLPLRQVLGSILRISFARNLHAKTQNVGYVVILFRIFSAIEA